MNPDDEKLTKRIIYEAEMKCCEFATSDKGRNRESNARTSSSQSNERRKNGIFMGVVVDSQYIFALHEILKYYK